MARHIGEIILRHSGEILGGPYVVLGHSVGAHVALHLARTLVEIGLPLPEKLVVLASRPPSHPDPESPLHQLSDERLAERLAGYGGMSAGELADPDLLELALLLVRADLRLVEEATRPQLPVPVPVSVVGAQSDASVPVDVLSHWGRVTSSTFDWQVVPGGHFFADRVALVAAVTSAIQEQASDVVRSRE
jgi:medium-chain acyl-[acyl-carrier-protein] hydrolase